MNEITRFIELYDKLTVFTHDCVAVLTAQDRQWQPVAGDIVRFGDRVTDVTIETLYVHVTVADQYWINALSQAEDGGHLAVPNDPDLTAELLAGDYLARSLEMHGGNLEILKGLDSGDLTRRIHFSGRNWSVMGFLWTLMGHRNYHLGNLDTYCRLAGIAAPDYFQFQGTEMP